ncbi:MAG: hypothetical protein B6I24_03510 [Bacteroidetes bacterium 4572_128]|nr:MAG: hypothetical protein B6I24_03510 [Bacteroidetes bacterium 4572_128]
MENEKNNLHNLYIGVSLLILATLIGTFGFAYFNNYSFADGFYMTIITMSTVGFGEVKPLSIEGKMFVSLLIIFSLGIFAYVITTFTAYIVEGGFQKTYRNYIMDKRIKKLKDHTIVCGYGRNGKQATQELLDLGQFVIVVEKQSGLISKKHMSHKNLFYIKGDSTQDEVLEKAEIRKAGSLITTLPHDADNLFVVLTSRAFNEKMIIISRASKENSDVKLKRAGANNVIMPDKVGGTRMAKLVVQPDIVEFLEAILLKSGVEVNLEEISCDELNSCFFNKTIAELNIRYVSGANLIGLKNKNGEYIFNPSPKIKLHKKDKLFALGTVKQINKLKKVLTGDNKKI